MATIGQTLSAARIAAGYTVADLSARTRIRERILKGIEKEDFAPCGGDFYARGHIRGVCRALGLDPAALLAEYDREHTGNPIPAFIPLQRHPTAEPALARTAAAHTEDDGALGPGTERWSRFERGQNGGRRLRRSRPRGVGATEGPGPRGTEEGRERQHRAGNGRHTKAGNSGDRRAGARLSAGPVSRPRATVVRSSRREAIRRHWPWAVVGAIAVLAVFVGVRAWQDWDEGDPLRTALGSDSAEGSLGSAARPESGTEGLVADEAAEEAVEITVGLDASTRSWIEVIDAEGEDLFTGFLLEGEGQDYVTEGPLDLWVGDAGAVSVSVDGKDLGPVGASGEVKEVTIGQHGFGH